MWSKNQIKNKTTIKDGLTQLNLHDGRNIVLKKEESNVTRYSTHDTVKISIPDQKILEKYELKIGNYGFESYRVVAVDESWTSKRCSRCNSKNTSRKKQGLFNCHDCGYELNADLNGAKNIGKRLIQKALKPKQESTCIGDLHSGEIYAISLFKCLKPLSQWLEDSSKNTSSL